MALIDQTVDNVIRLNMIPGTRKPRLHCSQYDVGRQVTLEVYNGDDVVVISANYLTIEGSKPDNTAYVYSVLGDLGGSVNGNIVKFNLVSQMANVAGECPCELVLYDSVAGERLGSLNFTIVVESSPIPGTATDSATDFSGLISVFNTAMDGMKDSDADLNNATATVEAANEILQEAVGKIVEYRLEGTTLYITAEEG